MSTESLSTHHGGCHCGHLTFEFQAPARVTVYRCNCSICSMQDFLHLIVPKDRFTATGGEPVTYEFGSGIAKHTFCGVCGIKPYYIPRSNPDGVSINFRCVDQRTISDVTILPFDGKNWEANAASLSHLSRE